MTDQLPSVAKPTPRKTQTHGRIGEAAVAAKCWMHGIPAYNTGGLRANFAGSDLIVETNDRHIKLWVQVKTGYPNSEGHVYLPNAAGMKTSRARSSRPTS